MVHVMSGFLLTAAPGGSPVWDARYDIHHDSFFIGSAGLRWRQGIRHYLQRADLDGSMWTTRTETKTWLRQLFVKGLVSNLQCQKGLYPNLACLKVKYNNQAIQAVSIFGKRDPNWKVGFYVTRWPGNLGERIQFEEPFFQLGWKFVKKGSEWSWNRLNTFSVETSTKKSPYPQVIQPPWPLKIPGSLEVTNNPTLEWKGSRFHSLSGPQKGHRPPVFLGVKLHRLERADG